MAARRIPLAELANWASRYPADYDRKVERLAVRVHKRGYLERDEFLAFCRWKTARSGPQCRRNAEVEVQEVTRLALSTSSERLRIESLLHLHGVSWPTASVLLHFCHREPYPILDFRALWSVGLEVPSGYDLAFWKRYVRICRGLANRTELSMRTVDRALWQYSKENGP